MKVVGQLSALVWLRFRLWWNGLRSRATAGDTAVGIVLAVLGTIGSLVLAFALAGVTHIGLLDGSVDSITVALTIVCWTIGFLAVVVPVIFGIGQPQVPLRRLVVFPFSRWQLYWIQLVAAFASGVHIFWYPILAAVVLVAVVLHGVASTSWSVVAAVFAVCLVVWSNTVVALVQHMLRQRRARELAILVGLVFVVAVSMGPAILQEQIEERGEAWFGDLIPTSVTSAVTHAGRVFPPSIAAAVLQSTVTGPHRGVSEALLLLFLWTAAGIGLGSAITFRTFEEEHSSGRTSGAVSSRRATTWLSLDRFGSLPVGVRAVAAKELRYLFRSTPGKFNVVIMPIFVIVMSTVVARDLDHSFLGLDRLSLIFIGTMTYASAFSNNFLFNAYAWEGAGVQSYFLCPVSPRHIVVGKNLGVWLYDAVLGIEAVIAFCVVSGFPGTAALAGGCLTYTAAVLAATTVGNVLSPIFPVPRNIGSITNSPSQIAIVTTLGMLITIVVVAGGLLVVPAYLGQRWLGPVLLLVLIAIEVVIYAAMSHSAARALESRRESLIQALQARAA